MKDHSTLWGRFLRRSYSTVNTTAVSAQCPEDECNYNTGRNVAKRILNSKCPSHFSIGFLGLFGLFIGFLIYVINPYDLIFKLRIVFEEGGEIFEMWREPPVDLYLRVFLYNVTNKEEFLSGTDKKLKVQEVGPYVYREMMSHKNVVFNDNGTVSAEPSHPLVWVPEMSIGDHETDQLILPHIALLSIADVVSDSSYFTKLALNLIIRQTKTHPLVQMSPKEFMFGYPSTLMTLGNKFLPNWINFDKLGLIDRMYYFEGDYETVFTGENDVRKAGLLDTYNGSPQMPQWESSCGNIEDASDGTKFQSHVLQNDTMKFFRKSMCRPQTLMHVNETVSSGLRGYVYKFRPNSMDNGHYNPENKCFCKTGRCLPAGLLDVRQCYYGFPIALSYPHFLDCDPVLSEYTEGSNPDRQQHETYFVINPESGLPLDLAVRFQINMALGKIKSIANVEKFEDMVLPLLWTEIRLYTLPTTLATRFHLYLNILPTAVTSIMYVMSSLGAIFMLVAIYKQIKLCRPNNQNNNKPNKTILANHKDIAWVEGEDSPLTIDSQCHNDSDSAVNDRLQSYELPTKRGSMTKQELKGYFDSLVAPMNQNLSGDDSSPYQSLTYTMRESDILN